MANPIYYLEVAKEYGGLTMPYKICEFSESDAVVVME